MLHISASENLKVSIGWEKEFWGVFVYFIILYSVGKDKDVKSAAMFIQQQFIDQNTVSGKVIYPHFTTATDTSNIQVVFQVVMDSILRDNLRKASIL